MITYKSISIIELLDQTVEIMSDHCDEVCVHKGIMNLDPDRERYKGIEARGDLFTIAAYDGEDIVGYSVSILGFTLHYKDLFYCQNDALFVAKPYRNSSCGLKLMKMTEDYASKMGAKLIMWHAKEESPLSKIMSKRGYVVQDIIYSKEV